MDTTVDEKWVAIYSDAQTLIRAWIMGEALDGDKDGITVSGIHFFRRLVSRFIQRSEHQMTRLRCSHSCGDDAANASVRYLAQQSSKGH